MAKPTLRHVALAAGVSTASVSRILNGSTAYSDDTIARVKQAASDLRYRPNAQWLGPRGRAADDSSALSLIGAAPERLPWRHGCFGFTSSTSYSIACANRGGNGGG